MKKSPSLLDYLHRQMDCDYLSDLHYLGPRDRHRLRRQVRDVSPGDAPLTEWNDALAYLAKGAPQPTAARAKERLLRFLEGGKGSFP